MLPGLHLILALATSAASAAPDARTSLHDGPNCFNAALLGAGFTEDVRHVDGSEFRFILEAFCRPRTGSARPGDLLLLDNGWAAHAALMVGYKTIYEKTSAAGLTGHQRIGREVPGLFQTKSESESPFFSGEYGEFVMTPFGCTSPAHVRETLERLDSEPTVRHITDLQRKLDLKIGRETIEPLDLLEGPVQRLTQILAKRTGADQNDVYVLTRAISVWAAVEYTLQETNSVFVTRLHALNKTLRAETLQLAAKIRSRTSDPSKLRVLREVPKA